MVTRAGIVPYREEADRLLFLMGVDALDIGSVADLGGRQEGEETSEQIAIREFMEESRSALTTADKLSKLLESAVIVTNGNRQLFFVPVDYEPERLRRAFHKSSCQQPECMEMVDLIELDHLLLVSLINGEENSLGLRLNSNTRDDLAYQLTIEWPEFERELLLAISQR